MWHFVPHPRSATVVPYQRATLTVVAGEVSADVSDFPIRVSLADLPAAFWSNVASDGSDIQIFDSVGAQLPRDLVTFNYAGNTGDLFFKASLLTASDNVFYVAAGSGAAAPSAGSTYGRNNVWTAYHRAFVFTGNSEVDRTGSGNDMTLTGGAVFASNLLDTDIATAYAYCTVSSYSDWAIGCICRGGDPSNNQVFAEYRNSGGTARAQLLYRSSGPLFAIFNDTDGLNTVSTSYGIGLALDRHFPVISHDGGTQRDGWLDGTNRITQSVSTSVPASGVEFRLSYPITDGYKGGYELGYFRAAVPTSAWIAAEYGSWFVPGDFYTVT